MSYEELAREMIDLHMEHYGEISQLASHMVMGGEPTILHLLLVADGDVFAEDLARQTGLTPGRVASILKKLEARGTITRTRCPENRRKCRIELTDAGRVEAEEAERSMLETHEEVLGKLGEEDARSFLRIVGRLCEIYQELQEGQEG